MRAWLQHQDLLEETTQRIHRAAGREVPEAHGYGVKAPELLVKGS